MPNKRVRCTDSSCQCGARKATKLGCKLTGRRYRAWLELVRHATAVIRDQDAKHRGLDTMRGTRVSHSNMGNPAIGSSMCSNMEPEVLLVLAPMHNSINVVPDPGSNNNPGARLGKLQLLVAQIIIKAKTFTFSTLKMKQTVDKHNNANPLVRPQKCVTHMHSTSAWQCVQLVHQHTAKARRGQALLTQQGWVWTWGKDQGRNRVG